MKAYHHNDHQLCRDGLYRVRPSKGGQASRIPRPLVMGRPYGPISPGMYALWSWIIGRGIYEQNVKCRYWPDVGALIPYRDRTCRGPWKTVEQLVRAARKLHARREECGIEFLSPYTGEIERVPLVRAAIWEAKESALRVLLDDRLVTMIGDYNIGYAEVNLSPFGLHVLKNLPSQRFYCYAALHRRLPRPWWHNTPETLAYIMGMPDGTRRGNIDAAIQRAVGEIKTYDGVGGWKLRYSPTYDGKTIKNYEFEFVNPRFDISRTGLIESLGSFRRHVPTGARQMVMRGLQRINARRRKKSSAPVDIEFEGNLGATRLAVQDEKPIWEFPTRSEDGYQYRMFVEAMKMADNDIAELEGKPLPHPELRDLFDVNEQSEPTVEELVAEVTAKKTFGALISLIEMKMVHLVPADIVAAVFDEYGFCITDKKVK